MSPKDSFEDMTLKVETFLDHCFANKTLIRHALWRLYPDHKNLHGARESERLELLGDKILGFLLADALFKRYKEAKDSQLSLALGYMSSNENCSYIIKKQDFFLQATSPKMHPSVRFFSHICETLIGALYCDSGLEKARTFVVKQWQENLHDFHNMSQDPKSTLQEWSQRHHSILPVYRVLSCDGKEHEPTYYVRVTVQELTADGSGSSKRQAEQKAATMMLHQQVQL